MNYYAPLALLFLLVGCGAATPPPSTPLPISGGNLHAEVRGNSRIPDDLSGIVSLRHAAAPNLEPFRSAGLNFEHILSTYQHPMNGFTPRKGRYYAAADHGGVVLTRQAGDDPWAVASTLTYEPAGPDAVDFQFEATVTDAGLFGERHTAAFFFASYMAAAVDSEITFRGAPGPGQPDTWVTSRPGPGPGESYIGVDAAPLDYDSTDPNLALNLSHVEWPRFAAPYYYGRCVGGMVYILMLDSPLGEFRFTVMRWMVQPAWDFVYVARNLSDGAKIGFRGRLIWKSFVSAEDVAAEYTRWAGR